MICIIKIDVAAIMLFSADTNVQKIGKNQQEHTVIHYFSYY